MFKTEELVVLLYNLLKSNTLMTRYADKIDKYKIFNSFPPALFIWQSMEQYWRKFHVAISMNLLKMDLVQRLESIGDVTLALEVQKILVKLKANDTLSEEYCTRMLNAVAADICRQNLLNILPNLNMADPVDVLNLKQATKDILTEDAETQPDTEVKSLFTNLGSSLREDIKRPLYIQWLDDMLGGGMSDGEMLSFIIPSGGGKTTLCLQMCEAAMRYGHHVTLVSTEQGAEADMKMRACIRASGISGRSWENVQRDLQNYAREEAEQHFDEIMKKHIPEPNIKRLELVRAEWDQYLQFLDYSSTPITSVEVMLNDLAQRWEKRGKAPYLLALDWFGPMIDSILQHAYLRSDTVERRILNLTIKTIHNFVKEWRLRFVMFHQMAGANLKANFSGKATASSYGASLSKSLPFYFQYSMAATQQFADQRFWLVADKARRTRQQKKLLKLYGDMYYIDQVEADAGVTIAD